MKTVKDYLDLGLVFVGDDELLSETNNKDSKGIIMSRCWLAHNRYDGFLEVADGFFSAKEWIPSSFAWRNNDGVNPEYNGLIEVECGSGRIQKGSSRDFMYWWDDGTIIKWRPVVLQSDGAYENNDASFKLPIGVDSPELREAFKSLKEYLENKATFWNKSIQTLNCPCVAVNIETNKPTASPRKDKPMKPVYTADMHAKGELPQVGADCILIIDSEPRQARVTYIGKSLGVCSNIDGGAECAFLLGKASFKPITKTIKVNGFDVPAPMSENIKAGDKYFFPAPAIERYFQHTYWDGGDFDKLNLARGTIHKTQESAIAHAKAMLGIDPNKDEK